MPIVAIGAAIGASVVAGSAVAATVGGIAAISAVTALEVTAAVGATVSAIGAVTRDKGLLTAGTVIGAIGAVGGLAAGAGLLGDAAASDAPLFGASTADSVADTTAAAEPVTAADAANGAANTTVADQALGGTTAADQASAGTIDYVNGAATPQVGTDLAASDAADVTKQLAVGQEGGTNAAGAVVGETPVSAPSGGVDAAATPATNPAPAENIPTPPLPPGGLGSVGTDGNTITSGVDAATGKIVSLPDNSTFGKILDYAGNHPVAALGVTQVAGSFLTGLTSTLTPAQVAQYNAQAAANNATAALTKHQQQNLAMPKSVASSAPVTGTPQTLVPGATGADQSSRPVAGHRSARVMAEITNPVWSYVVRSTSKAA